MEVDIEFRVVYENGIATSFHQNVSITKGHFYNEWRTKLIEKNSFPVTLEVRVKIEKTTGLEREVLIKFDESVKKFSDVVLVVKDRKFHVSKMTLAFQSSYFESLLMGSFDESQKSEIVLNHIGPSDFQRFLELIHGASPLNDSTVDGILHLVDMYDAKIALGRCEEFLMEKSQKRRDIKLKLAIQYNLECLKEKCLSGIRTRNDIKEIVNAGLDKLDWSISSVLLQKALVLN